MQQEDGQQGNAIASKQTDSSVKMIRWSHTWWDCSSLRWRRHSRQENCRIKTSRILQPFSKYFPKRTALYTNTYTRQGVRMKKAYRHMANHWLYHINNYPYTYTYITDNSLFCKKSMSSSHANSLSCAGICECSLSWQKSLCLCLVQDIIF